MRDVLPELMQWWRAGRAGRRRHRRRHVPLRPAPRRGLDARRPRRRGRRLGLRRLRRGRGLRAGPGGRRRRAPRCCSATASSDDDAFAVGLTCGGILDVFVETVAQETFPELGEVADDIEAGRPVAVATVIDHPDPAWVGRRLVVRPEGADAADADRLAGQRPRADAAVTDDARGLLAAGRTETLTYGPDGERRGEGLRVFVAAYAPRPRMLVFGAIDFAAAVAHVGAFLGYRVTVCDARPVFATASRFPAADEVVVEWPHRYLAAEVEAGRVDGRTVVCVLTHDPKFDVPAARGGAADAGGRLRRRDGLAAHPRRPARAAARGRAHRGRAGPAVVADRARPRRPHPGGDRGVDRGRDRRAAVGRRGPAAAGDRRLDPPPPRSARFPERKADSACGSGRIASYPLWRGVTSGEDHEHVTVHTCRRSQR